jgi:hypothetical protein
MNFLRNILPPESTMLVDISNMKDEQLRALENRGHTLFLLSTQKSFNYRASQGTLPTFLREGTVWAVLTIPFVNMGATVGMVSKFSPRLQRFEHRRLPRRSTSPRLRYHEHSLCSIRSHTNRSLSKRPVHSACEIDDLALATLRYATDLPLATNDRALKRMRVRPTLSSEMASLAKATRIVSLVLTKGKWKVV